MNIQSTHRTLQLKRAETALSHVPPNLETYTQPTDTFEPSKPEPPSILKAALGGAAVGAFVSGSAVVVLAEAVGAFSYMGGGGGNLGAVVAGTMAYGGICGAILAAVNREHL